MTSIASCVNADVYWNRCMENKISWHTMPPKRASFLIIFIHLQLLFYEVTPLITWIKRSLWASLTLIHSRMMHLTSCVHMLRLLRSNGSRESLSYSQYCVSYWVSDCQKASSFIESEICGKLKDGVCRLERKRHILKQDWVIAVCNRKFRSGVYLGENGNN